MALTDSASHLPPTSGAQNYNADIRPVVGAATGFYVDSVFGETVRRLTNIGEAQSFDDMYSHCRANADGTRCFHNPNTTSLLNIVDTSTGTILYSGLTPGTDEGDVLWHPTDPNKYFYKINSGASRGLYEWTLGVGGTRIKDFGANIATNGNSVNWVDKTGRYFTINFGAANHVWDRIEDVVYTGTIADYATNAWVGITPSGKHAVIRGPTAGGAITYYPLNHVANSVGTGIMIWSAGGDHAVPVSGSDGNDYAIVQAFGVSPGGLYVCDVRDRSGITAANQQTAPGVTLLLTLVGNTWDCHMCAGPNGNGADWTACATEATTSGVGRDNINDVPGVNNVWAAYKQEIILINYLTLEKRRVAHHRSRSVQANYYYFPRTSCSWDMSLVMWASNFNHSVGGVGYSDTYIVPNPLAPAVPVPVSGTLGATQANQTTAIRGWTTTLFNFATTQANNTAAFVYKKNYRVAIAGTQSDNTGAFTALFGISQPKGTMAGTSLVSGLWGGKIHGSFVRVGNNFEWAATQDDNTASIPMIVGIKGEMAGHEIVSGLWGGRLHSEFGFKGVTYAFAMAATQGNATAAFQLAEAHYFSLATTQADNTVAIAADATTQFQFNTTQDDNTAAWEYVPNASIFFSIEPTESDSIADFGMHSDATPELGHHGGDDEKGEHDEHDYMKKLKQQFKRKQEKSVLAVIQKFLETVE